MADSVTVLLMLEAIDKASQIIEGISGKLEGLGARAQEAAAKASMTGDELEAAQVKAEAAANAYAAAVEEESAAQARLIESTQAVRDAQVAAAESAARLAEADQAIASGAEEAANVAQVSYADIAAAAESSAAAAKAAVAGQVEALDALNVAQKESAVRAEESAAATDAANTSVDVSGSLMKGAAMGAALTAAAVAGIGYESIKAAGNFQSLTTHLVTDAGESQANLAKVQAGILSISTATGTSTTELVNGMYHIESAGYHGAAALTMLKTAAEGAKVGNADLDTVSRALVGAMNAYGMSAGQSTSMMNQLIATVGAGDMRMEDLASSMSSVTASAAAAHISFAQVAGAIATMTAQGMSANQATQDLNHTIGAMSNPNQVQIKEMQAMGLSSNQVSQDLGKQGLTGTFAELTAAVAKHIQGGQVLISTFQASQQAAADANVMIKAMPSSLQKLADAYLSGSITQKQWASDLQGLPPVQAAMMKQFATLADKTHAFNQQLTSGSPAAQTYNAAMSKMMGGTVGLNTALMLTGTHAATFSQNVATVSAAAKTGGNSVANWSAIQGTMNQKLDQLKASVEAASIGLGTALIPMVTKALDVVMKIVTPIVNWIAHNQKLAAMILLVVGAIATGITVFVMAAKAIELVTGAVEVFGAITEGLEFNPVILAITALAVVALLIVTHWSTVKKWMVEFWDWLKKVFSDAVSFVKSHVQEIAAGLVLLLGPIGLLIAAVLEIATHWRQVEAVLKDVWNWIKGAAEDVAKTVSHAFTTSVHTVEAAWSDLVGALRSLWGGIVGVWNATGGKLVTGIAHAWDQVSAAFDKEWSKISGDLSSIWGSLVQIWNATGGAMISAIEQSVEYVVSFIRDHWQQIKTIVNDVLAPLVTIVRTVWNAIKTVFTAAFDFISGLVLAEWDVVKGLFEAAWDAIRAAVQLGWDLVKGIFTAAFDVISGLVSAAWDVVSGIFKAAWDVIMGLVKAAWDAVTTTINAALDIVKGIFKAFADLLTGQWGKLWNDVKSTFSSVWNDISGFFKKILGDIGTTVSGAVSSIFGGFEKGIKDAISGVSNALSDVYNGIVGFFKDAGNWLYQIGKDILSGLINGAESALGDVKNFFTGIASDIISWKGPPSYDAVMLTGNGQLIMKGLITGIDSQTDALHAKLGSITASIKADMTGPQTLGQAYATGLGGAASQGAAASGNVYITVEGGNTLMSDSDQTKFANLIGSKVVTTIVPQGGVNLPLR